MAFGTYIPNMYTPMMQPQPQPQQGVIWVSGEAGAKSYLVAPNTTVALWDSENSTIYLKSADASGMPSLKILDYTIREGAQTQAPIQTQPEYVTHKELEEFEKKIIQRLEDTGA